MRPKERIPRILKKIEELWTKVPDQRLGQLMENYLFIKGERGDRTSTSLFFQEDDSTEEILDELLEDGEPK